MKNIKYLCRKCSAVKSPALISAKTPNSESDVLIEVIKEFETTVTDGEKTETRKFTGRKLECGHFINVSTPGFTDATSENLNEDETLIIRRILDKAMLGLQRAELEAKILFHCEQYNTLLKIASKQRQQAKYAIIYLDELKNRYLEMLSDDDAKQSFEMKFAHFLDLRPTTNKVIERERSTTDKAVEKQKAALEAMKDLLKNKGFDPKELFGKKTESNSI